ncbi:hypothetical protein CTKZ_16060 [Cellulomonas algicola]|uniref:DUF559 domain-containing protein n=1 Tax=Cellulomonas algicola TaxID=2071633 RepID=A0A401UZK7_9CELL|nr:type IV toxin-antitoxin system AbiEi family antitoxin domain-containing protein [Cellulomonas algicola]GCD20044.1 hypothetical protein CTKZ_16060 [Cellulomonas algicola]
MPARSDVPLSLLTLARRQGGLVSAAQASLAGIGGSRRSRLVSSGRWSRRAWSVYDVEPGRRRSLDERRQESAWLGLLAFGPEAIAVGGAALVLHGVAGLPAVVRPEVALPGGRHLRDRDGITVRCFGDPLPFPVSRYGAGNVARLPWALAQAVPQLGARHAVAVLDDVLRRGLLPAHGLSDVRRLVERRRGAASVRDVWDLVDPRAESPLETFARVDCIAAGLPPDDLQVVVRSADGTFLGRADLGWRLRDGGWLLAEIDGRDVHEAPEALLRDRRRQNALLATGRVRLLRFTAADLGASRALVRTVAASLACDRRPGPGYRVVGVSGHEPRVDDHVGSGRTGDPAMRTASAAGPVTRTGSMGEPGQVGVIGRGGDDDD